MTTIEAHLSSIGFTMSTPGVWTGTVPDGCPVQVTLRLHPVRGIVIDYTRHARPPRHVRFRSPCQNMDEVRLAIILARARWLDESTTSIDTQQREHVRSLVCHI